MNLKELKYYNTIRLIHFLWLVSGCVGVILCFKDYLKNLHSPVYISGVVSSDLIGLFFSLSLTIISIKFLSPTKMRTLVLFTLSLMLLVYLGLFLGFTGGWGVNFILGVVYFYILLSVSTILITSFLMDADTEFKKAQNKKNNT